MCFQEQQNLKDVTSCFASTVGRILSGSRTLWTFEPQEVKNYKNQVFVLGENFKGVSDIKMYLVGI